MPLAASHRHGRAPTVTLLLLRKSSSVKIDCSINGCFPSNALTHASTCRSTTTGSVNANVEPWPGCDSTQIRPPQPLMVVGLVSVVGASFVRVRSPSALATVKVACVSAAPLSPSTSKHSTDIGSDGARRKRINDVPLGGNRNCSLPKIHGFVVRGSIDSD
jgi:hypothetical protein